MADMGLLIGLPVEEEPTEPTDIDTLVAQVGLDVQEVQEVQIDCSDVEVEEEGSDTEGMIITAKGHSGPRTKEKIPEVVILDGKRTPTQGCAQNKLSAGR